MNFDNYPYIPNHISFRRYNYVNIYDLRNDESFIVDEEAYLLLSTIDGYKTINEILEHFPQVKRKEIKGILNDFEELGIIHLSSLKIADDSIKSTNSTKIPMKNPFKPPYLMNLMVNITEKCNLTCNHCYISNKNPIDFLFDKLIELILQFYDYQGIRLILTGGEPLIYSKFKDLLEFLKDIPLQKVLLTNAILIEKNQDLFELLKKNYFEVYVSLDGLEGTHNDFRNSDCFKDTIKGIELLLNHKISVSINTMVHKQNLNEFDDMLKLLNSLGAIKNWSIDIPTFDDSTPESIREKYEITPEEGGQILKDYGWGVIFESDTESSDLSYACGPHLIAVDVSGTITKCGFFTEKSVGNIFKLGLKKAWELTQKNLNWNLYDLKCAELECEFIEDCRGGCRYRCFKHTGDLLGIDIFKCHQFGKIIDQEK